MKTLSFAINITHDQLLDFYYSLHSDLEPDDFLSILNGEDGNKYFDEMVLLYLEKNFAQGNYCIIQDAHGIVKQLERKGQISAIFNEFNIDLSHLFGMTEEELVLLAIPMKSTNEMFSFGDMIGEKFKVVYFGQSEFLGHN